MNFRLEKPALSLILSNLFTIVLAIVEKWSLSDVMWIYWGQSVVIGFFNWRRIRCLHQFSTEGFTINDEPVAPTPATQRQVAFFFALHYGLFHAAYFAFLYHEAADLSLFGLIGVAACLTMFAANHRFSFRHNLERDLSRKPNIGTIMFFPYARVVPMHITILAGEQFTSDAPGTMILFLSLKTLADLLMHLIEHREGRR